jgi:hypothetical protein
MKIAPYLYAGTVQKSVDDLGNLHFSLVAPATVESLRAVNAQS